MESLSSDHRTASCLGSVAVGLPNDVEELAGTVLAGSSGQARLPCRKSAPRASLPPPMEVGVARPLARRRPQQDARRVIRRISAVLPKVGWGGTAMRLTTATWLALGLNVPPKVESA